jgi:hypothetical protein
MFKSEAEREAARAERATREQQASQERAMREAQEREAKAREAYLESPVGQAETAYKNEQAFFQFVTPISKIEGKSSDWYTWGNMQRTSTSRFHATDVLGQIEELGWHLQDVGYVFVETGEVSRSKVMSSGAVSRTQGYVEGIYLFRRR